MASLSADDLVRHKRAPITYAAGHSGEATATETGTATAAAAEGVCPATWLGKASAAQAHDRRRSLSAVAANERLSRLTDDEKTALRYRSAPPQAYPFPAAVVGVDELNSGKRWLCLRNSVCRQPPR
jgi:hypothetical protein